MRGSHLYGSVSGKQFFAKGMGFPNVGKDADIKDWIAVLERVHELGPDINTIRIYIPPTCSLEANSTCFTPFMKKADEFGIYVLIPASGDRWGWFPGTPKGCNPPLKTDSTDLNGCYTAGGLLGFGRTIINNFNYPNVLAIVLANEVEQNYQAFPVLKAYARDMKDRMKLCNTHEDSPTKGKMRQIPLTYAGTDTGNDAFLQLSDYLLCDSKNASLDIVGINIERWVSDDGGRKVYSKLNELVGQKKWPAAWLHTEEGGHHPGPQASRTWHQLEGFFGNFSNFDGYLAFSYYSDTHDFDMFTGNTASADILPDGKTFFKELGKSGPDPASVDPKDTVTPKCASSLSRASKSYPMIDYTTIQVYDTGANGWAASCPAPWQDAKQTVEDLPALVI